MEFKGTPGPWRIQFMDPENPEESDFWVKSDHNPVVHYGTDIMAEDFGEHNGYPREQRLADAHLIAASQDLLQMLTDLTEHEKRVYDVKYKSAVAHNNTEGVGINFGYASLPDLPN
jgi:hypothetical protein